MVARGEAREQLIAEVPCTVEPARAARTMRGERRRRRRLPGANGGWNAAVELAHDFASSEPMSK